MFAHVNISITVSQLLAGWAALMVFAGYMIYEGLQRRREHNDQRDLKWAQIWQSGGLSTVLYSSTTFLLPALGLIVDRQWMHSPESRPVIYAWFFGLSVPYGMFIGLQCWLAHRLVRSFGKASA